MYCTCPHIQTINTSVRPASIQSASQRASQSISATNQNRPKYPVFCSSSQPAYLSQMPVSQSVFLLSYTNMASQAVTHPCSPINHDSQLATHDKYTHSSSQSFSHPWSVTSTNLNIQSHYHSRHQSVRHSSIQSDKPLIELSNKKQPLVQSISRLTHSKGRQGRHHRTLHFTATISIFPPCTYLSLEEQGLYPSGYRRGIITPSSSWRCVGEEGRRGSKERRWRRTKRCKEGKRR